MSSEAQSRLFYNQRIPPRKQRIRVLRTPLSMPSIKKTIQIESEATSFTNMHKIFLIEQSFVSGRPLFKDDRLFLKQGVLVDQHQTYFTVYLFNDCVVFGTVATHGKHKGKLLKQRILPLQNMTIEGLEERRIAVTSHGLTLLALSDQDYTSWLNMWKRAIKRCSPFPTRFSTLSTNDNINAERRKASSIYSFSSDIYGPSWVPDSHSDDCMLCETTFSMIIRKHHCRTCGLLICYRCSRHRDRLPGYRESPVRICVDCDSKSLDELMCMAEFSKLSLRD